MSASGRPFDVSSLSSSGLLSAACQSPPWSPPSPPSLPSPPWPPLERVVTCPLPVVEPPEPCELVRVVTGPPDEPEPVVEPEPPCEVLVRVATGAPDTAALAGECGALVRVVTAAPLTDTVVPDPTRCEPLAPVCTALAAGEAPRRPRREPPPDGPIPWRACSCRVM